MVKNLPDVLIRFEPVTDEGVASLAGSGRYDRKSSGIYIVKVYDESGALLTVPAPQDQTLKFVAINLTWRLQRTRSARNSPNTPRQRPRTA